MANILPTSSADAPAPPRLSIPKQQVAGLPVVQYPGQVRVIDTPEAVDDAVADLMRADVLGFDTETRPSFRRGEANKVALMQVSNDEVCYLFRLNRIGFPDALRRLVEAEKPLKVGLSIRDDFSVMHRSDDVFEPAGFVDLQDVVGRWGIADASLQRIYAIVFGGRISKGQRLTNWEATTLTPFQQAYAALDAWACLKLWRHLTSGAFDPAASPYQAPIDPASVNA